MDLTWFRIGSAAIVVLGVGHLAIAVPRALSRQPAQRALDALLRGQVVSVLGRECNLRDLNTGFSVAMGLIAIALGAEDLLCASTPGIAASSSLAWLNLGLSLVLLAISIRAFPPPPIVVLSVASVCFGLAL